YIQIEDGEAIPFDRISQAMEFIREQQQTGKHILIACGAGISRSTAFSMAALREIESCTLLDAYHLIRQHHPDAMPHPVLLKSLCEYYEERESLPALVQASTGFYPE
ncbi:MAG TPA: dual specificity protein phosphatase family protein, partial [Aggregatilineales bacterium]|nr:dual specificity protein phosphatase family protein [Aggregatilineales bacterium]